MVILDVSWLWIVQCSAGNTNFLISDSNPTVQGEDSPSEDGVKQVAVDILVVHEELDPGEETKLDKETELGVKL